MRYGQTLPRNYGGARSPSNLDREGSEEEDARRGAEIEELRNFKTPDLAKFEDQEEEEEEEEEVGETLTLGFRTNWGGGVYMIKFF